MMGDNCIYLSRDRKHLSSPERMRWDKVILFSNVGAYRLLADIGNRYISKLKPGHVIKSKYLDPFEEVRPLGAFVCDLITSREYSRGISSPGFSSSKLNRALKNDRKLFVLNMDGEAVVIEAVDWEVRSLLIKLFNARREASAHGDYR